MDNVLEKIEKMRKERGWSINRLAVEAELTQSTVAHMFARETLPSLHTLECICNAFGVTMAQFFAEESNANYLSNEEKCMVAKYRELNNRDRESVKAIIEALAKKYEY